MNVNWTNFGMFIVLAMFVLPPLLVLFSSRVRGYDKLGWTLTSLFLSWLGFMVFLVARRSKHHTSSRIKDDG